MALLIVYDGAILFRSRRIDVRSRWGFLSEREINGLSSIFGAARKYGSGCIEQVILIGWKCSATLTVKSNYAPNKNSSFFLLQTLFSFSPFRCGSRIHRLHHCWGVRPRLHLISVQDMTLNRLKVRFQLWRFEECEISLHCHCSRVHSQFGSTR